MTSSLAAGAPAVAEKDGVAQKTSPTKRQRGAIAPPIFTKHERAAISVLLPLRWIPVSGLRRVTSAGQPIARQLAHDGGFRLGCYAANRPNRQRNLGAVV